MSTSEQKKPQAGEWWKTERGERVRIVGHTSAGRMFVEYNDGAVTSRYPATFDDWHHEPRCDGWDWQPEPDPDEWVTQDRVPCRPGIDERRWIYRGHQILNTSLLQWEDCLNTKGNFGDRAIHGFEHPLTPGMRLELRCRRRDLPPIPEPKPATQREVLLYWYDGNVVGRYADCPPTDPSFTPLIIRDGKVFIETETREVVR